MSGRPAAQRPCPCLVIDQHEIDTPDFPRDQAWWDHFMPHGWTKATVRPDGRVFITVSGEAHPSQGPRPPAVVQRNQESAVISWLARNPRLEVAIVEDLGDPCPCWHPRGVFLHAGHCCFKTARVCHANREITRRAAALARRYLRYAIKFDLDAEGAEPTDANLKRILDRCVRPARRAEFPEIRHQLTRYRADRNGVAA
jgi:hypothetical protein